MTSFIAHIVGIARLYRYLLTTPSRQNTCLPKNWILGHRGARASAPENTLSSFKYALQEGADGVEFDVSVSADGIPVIIHDETVDRTTNSVGLVKNFTAKELKELDATKTIKNFPKEGIPTLEETLALFPDNAIINIELKDNGNLSKNDYIEKVITITKKYHDRLWLIISSFDGEMLALFREKQPDAFISLLISLRDDNWPSSLNYLPQIHPNGFHLPRRPFFKGFIKLAHKKNMIVAIWTINSKDEAKRWLQRGVDGIFTDYVSKMVSKLRNNIEN